jgi:hypothetical protein
MSKKVKTTWQQKLADDKDLPKRIQLDGVKAERWKCHSMVVPAPREVDAVMKKVPKGRLATIHELRVALAEQHNVEAGCPITTGIFAWIAAHAAAEAAGEGKSRVTPYWRTLKAKGELNPKYPGGIAGVREKLEAEGHRIVQKGDRYYVENFQKSLIQP